MAANAMELYSGSRTKTMVMIMAGHPGENLLARLKKGIKARHEATTEMVRPAASQSSPSL
ncbi:MAG: hypothetical protein E4H46_00320 [Desulfobacterales bacterium]|nr:MAG: hypothetical protein E4H46_00320 [Desulfobacterales bacterium]